MMLQNKCFLALSMLMAFSLSATNHQISLIHQNNNFSVQTDEGIFPIQRCYMDKELRGISEERLAKFAAAGAYLKLNKMEDSNDYTLRLCGRLNGGGVVLANVFYWGVKSLGYGVPATIAVASVGAAAAPLLTAGGAASAAGGTIVATSGAAISATAAAGISSGAAATAGTVIAPGVTSALMAGGATAAGVVGAAAGEAIIGAVGLEAAATGTAAAMGGGAVSAGTYVAVVEAVATGAFGAGMAVWWLP